MASEGRWVEGNEMVTVFVNYFTGLFTSSNPTEMDSIFNIIGNGVTDDVKADLEKSFTALEVKQAVHQMPAGKSPGPDGMSA
ncbi:hypothetical protein DITRI_Ditri20bG0124700 [Diplodiscus trichospermus]